MNYLTHLQILVFKDYFSIYNEIVGLKHCN
jgi:hypothetical protein